MKSKNKFSPMMYYRIIGGNIKLFSRKRFPGFSYEIVSIYKTTKRVNYYSTPAFFIRIINKYTYIIYTFTLAPKIFSIAILKASRVFGTITIIIRVYGSPYICIYNLMQFTRNGMFIDLKIITVIALNIIKF